MIRGRSMEDYYSVCISSERFKHKGYYFLHTYTSSSGARIYIIKNIMDRMRSKYYSTIR